MKKTLSIIAIIVGFSASAQINRDIQPGKEGMQQQKHFGQKHHMNRNMMKELNFSEAQKAQMKTNREEYKTKMGALKLNQDITVREYNAKKDALNKEQKEKMQSLLTPEQKNKMTEMKTKREQEMKVRNEKRFEEMKTKLSLSEDQAIKLKAQNESTSAEIKKIRENESLSREEKHKQMKAIKEASMNQRKNILTPDQQKKMEEMKMKHKKGQKAQSI